MSDTFDKSNIDKEYIEFIVDLYVGFLRNMYKTWKSLEKYHWVEDEQNQKIAIGAGFRDNESITKPQIVVVRGEVGWANLSFDPYKSGYIDNTNTTFMDLMPGVVTIDHYSRKSYESSTLALLSFVVIRLCKIMFKENGFQDVTTVTLGRTTQAKNDYYVTPVLSAFKVKFEWIKKKLVKNLTEVSIILKDDELDKVMNEILVTY